MKALVKTHRQEKLELEDVPVPEISINDVLVRILKTSICGTDLHIWNWDDWAKNTIPVPMIVGHEFVGRIEAVGANVHDYSPGDLVSGEGHLVCGRCRNCMAGRRHLCTYTQGVGVNRPGAFAEFLAIPVTNIWPCDPTIPLDVLSCFDPLGNATHTALSFNVMGEDVLITGAGPIGIMAGAIARHCGARHIVITDVNPYRLKLAKTLIDVQDVSSGSAQTLTIDPTQHSLPGVIQELGMAEGFDVGMEMSGHPSAFTSMLDVMCHGGKIALLGILPPSAINWNTVVFNGLMLKGIYGREMYETWYKMTMMLKTGLNIAPLITHRFDYTEFEKGFAAMQSGRCGKVILNWASE